MCGFAGLVGTADESLIARMVARLQHRGPDDVGLQCFPSVPRLGPAALGFRRLSIIDLSPAGHQPMANEDATVWVVFNGEIYNFAEVRSELERHGHLFRSRTDTEVILHGYEQWGDACVERFNGMFAFAVLDRARGRVVLMRDRLGIKPLYYLHLGGRLAFASEVKALLECPDARRAMDWEALEIYLKLGYVPGTRTLFSGIRRLEAGTRLVYDGATLEVQPYWSIPPHAADGATVEELAHRFHDLLRDAVQRQLVSDVPLGAFLSGGLDSSAVVAIMARELGVARLKTFCVGYEDRESRHDERAHAEALSSWLGTAHHTTVCTRDDAVERLPELVWHLDEPIAEDVLPAYLRLCRAAREDVTVVLTGEGSDEFGYGYRFYGLERIRQRWRYLPARLRRALRHMVGRHAPSGSLPARSAEYCLQDDEVAAFLTWSHLTRDGERQRLYGPEGRRHASAGDVEAEMRQLRAHRTERGVDLVSWLDARQRLVDYILLRSDRLSMAVGLEARVPFLDHRVVEFMSQVPAAMKLQGFNGKRLLRRAMAGVLPEENLRRRKKPFGAPVAQWLAAALPRYLSQSRLVEDGILSRAGLDEVTASRGANPRRYDEQGWALVMLEVWYRLFIRQDLDAHSVERVPAQTDSPRAVTPVI